MCAKLPRSTDGEKMVVECDCRQCSKEKSEMLENVEVQRQQGGISE